MLTKKDTEKRQQIQFLCIDELVPREHLLRKIENALDFSFIREEVKDLYCSDNGRPSIDPVILFKLSMINYLYGLHSMRRTIRESEVNMAYRWFLGYDIMEKVPHFTTWGKNYSRRFEGTDIFERIFTKVLTEALECGLVESETVFVDGTHIRANANLKKNYKEQAQKAGKHYHKELMREINEIREADGKKPFDGDDNSGETVTETKSKTDPESGLFHKGEHKKCFAYNAQTACDRNNFVLAVNVVRGNTHDSVAFDGLYAGLKERLSGIKSMAMDSAYRTPWIMKQVMDDGIIPVVPYHAPMTKTGFYKKNEYRYVPYSDSYICPNGKELSYTTTNREGYREYKSNCNICAKCPNREKCTHSKNMVKVITRHIWADYVEDAERIRYTPYAKERYALRSETIERVFADAKEKHGLRYARYRGLEKTKSQVLMTFACMNLKKLAKHKWLNPQLPRLLFRFSNFLPVFCNLLKKQFIPKTKTVSASC